MLQTVEMLGIRKVFPGVVANENVSFAIARGEIVGLLGENGAGKSTLMNVLYGRHAPDSGEIRVNGQTVVFGSSRDAVAAGIGMVHQHYLLVRNHSVAENIAPILADTPFFFPLRHTGARIVEAARDLGWQVDPQVLVSELSAGEQQRVEIIRALLTGADLLILDEPTSVLTPQEAGELFAVLKSMAARGKAIIFISHKLDEIMALTHRILVLKKGRLAGERQTSQTSKQELANFMVGHEVSLRVDKEPLIAGNPVLTVEHLAVKNNEERLVVQDVSFAVRAGEIFGIAGISGNGQKELLEALTGMRCPVAGRIFLGSDNVPRNDAPLARQASVEPDVNAPAGKEMTRASPRQFLEQGVCHIPEERLSCGAVPAFSLQENAALKSYYRPPLSSWGLLDPGASRDMARRIIEEFQVAAPSVATPIKNLSGGNVQKFLLGRELSGNPRLIIAAHPTYGVDIGAAVLIRQLLVQRRRQGAAILLVSEDLDELLEITDTIAVIFRGRLMGIMPSPQASLERLGLMMAGCPAS